MPPRRGRRRAPWGWIALVALALGVGYWGGRGWRAEPPGERPKGAPAPARPEARAPAPAADGLGALEAVLGVLDPEGVRMGVADAAAAEALLERLEGVAGVAVGAVIREPGRVRASLHVADRVVPLELWWTEAAAGAGRPRIAVVIDDLGGDLAVARAFLDLPMAVTPAILPHLTHSRGAAELARSRGADVILHLPMEPQGYPDRDPGEGALLAAMGEAELRRAVEAALASVPGVVGVNNHMGSRLTELPVPLGWITAVLGARGLYFLDSATSPGSVAAQVARDGGLPWARRDVFLDNVQTVEAVAAQLAKTVAVARAKGQAVAIGHPHPETLEALKGWAPRLDALGVEVVPLGRLVRRGGGA